MAREAGNHPQLQQVAEDGDAASNGSTSPPSPKEIVAWAMFDFAQLGSYTLVLTTIFNCYFINVIARGATHLPESAGTLVWTLTMSVSSLLIVITAPVLGAIVDHNASKKRALVVTSLLFAVSTSLLGRAGPGDIAMAVPLIIVCNLMSWTSLNLAGAFLPEISTRETIGRISGLGAALSYAGVLVTLSACAAYVGWAENNGQTSQQFVPALLDLTSLLFVVSCLPTFLYLRERAQKRTQKRLNFVAIASERLKHGFAAIRDLTDLRRVLLAIVIYSCGASAVLLLAAVYAQDIMGFAQSQVIGVMLITSLAAGAGAVAFGFLQDRMGSVFTLKTVLSLWIVATVSASIVPAGPLFWLVAIMIGIAAGGLKGVSRALIGQLSPDGRSAEFFGLWGLSINLAYAIGPLVYGLTAYVTSGNHRLAVLSSTCFFIVGLAVLSTVNERRGADACRRVES